MASIIVGIADMNIAKAPDTLLTLGLGSCVGLVLYDPITKIGGMMHIMLPSAVGLNDMSPKGIAKYADTAFYELKKRMLASGASPYQLLAKMAGGAHMFGIEAQSDIMRIGQRNVDICKKLLMENAIPIRGEDTGGTKGRTIEFSCDTGMLNIRTAFPKKEISI